MDGLEFLAEPSEKKDFDAALAIFREGRFADAQTAFADFLRQRYPQQRLQAFGALLAGQCAVCDTRNYKEAIANFKRLLAQRARPRPRA